MQTAPQAPTNTPLHRLVDSHCHLDFADFDTDRQSMLERSARAGVIAHILPATIAIRWPLMHELTQQYDNLFAVYGLHPMFMQQHGDTDIATLDEFIGHTPSAVGIGECGLDPTAHGGDEEDQAKLFAAQLELARAHDLPVVIHARGAVEKVINAIRSSGDLRGMVHSFNGSEQQAGRLIDLGFRLGFGGAMTYTRARKLRRVLASIPLDSLLLETDSPDQSDARHPGQRNEPAWLADVFDVVCELRSEPAEMIAQQTTDNAVNLFGLEITELDPG